MCFLLEASEFKHLRRPRFSWNFEPITQRKLKFRASIIIHPEQLTPPSHLATEYSSAQLWVGSEGRAT